HEVALEGDLERMLLQRMRLLVVAAAVGDRSLRPERHGERLREPIRLGDVERELGARGGPLEIAAEPVDARELRGKLREVFVRLVGRDHVECALEPRERLLAVTGERLELTQSDRDPGGGMRVAGRLVDLEG